MPGFEPVTLDQWIEDILRKYPDSQDFLSKRGIVCVMCGEPVWGSLDEQMDEKGFDDAKKKQLLESLNEFLEIQKG